VAGSLLTSARDAAFDQPDDQLGHEIWKVAALTLEDDGAWRHVQAGIGLMRL
jgi:hypothetical protein